MKLFFSFNSLFLQNLKINLVKALTMKDFWNERFGQSEYIYGKAPNVFLVEKLRELQKGTLLLPAEGEGRNAVYAALKGWNVTAFDYSKKGKQKALELASEYDITINYQLHNADEFSASEQYDTIALIFAHFAGEERKLLFQKLDSCLTQGGHLIIEVFSKNQLGRDSGGPKNLDLLYSKDEIVSLFPGIEFKILEETKVLLDEGSHHQGEAAVIRAVGVKKA
jgi:cyclopropane fatty-acyl-phospholipid synthase-like methyltransferase